MGKPQFPLALLDEPEYAEYADEIMRYLVSTERSIATKTYQLGVRITDNETAIANLAAAGTLFATSLFTMNVFTPSDLSGAIVTGGVAQTLSAVNASRGGFHVLNQSGEDYWINYFGGTAAPNAAGSFRIAAGELFKTTPFIAPRGVISLYGPTTGDVFSAAQWNGTVIGTIVNRSGTIATGGVAQALMPANAARLGATLQNNTNNILWYNDTGGTAAPNAAGSYPIYPNTLIVLNSLLGMSIYSDTTGDTYTALEF